MARLVNINNLEEIIVEHLYYLKNEFNNLDLINDSFTDQPFSIHIDLEPNLYQLDDFDEINTQYFDNVYTRAMDLFDDTFENHEHLYFVTVVRSEKSLQKPIGIYNKYIKGLNKYKLKTKKFEDEDEQINQYSLACQKQDLDYKNIIKAMCNQDFPELMPRFRNKLNRYPQLYFINTDRGIILHIYDDRGAFILFNNAREHKAFREKYAKED